LCVADASYAVRFLPSLPFALRLPFALIPPQADALLLRLLQRAEKTHFDSIRFGKWFLLSDGLNFYARDEEGEDLIDPSCRLSRFGCRF
jgi:hypothetical protein